MIIGISEFTVDFYIRPFRLRRRSCIALASAPRLGLATPPLLQANRTLLLTFVDQMPKTAHNTFVLIDQTRAVTGSFKFFQQRRVCNAENLLLYIDGLPLTRCGTPGRA
jgi:hypothetical protein